ncbi:DUF167 family protein [Brevundimonas sp.]|uniref:DUF167 family protein n=1 Tax=Brevundimonas sp. TaxID=1871086 RepID=UPI0039195FAE
MTRLTVRLTPRGGADRIDGWDQDPDGRPLLRARVRAAPTDGEANTALTALIARGLGISKSDVTIARGASARVKALEIRGLSESEIRARMDLKI